MKSEDDFDAILTELKKIGVKVPKSKKFKSIVSKQEKALPQSKSKIFGVSLCDQEWTADSDCLLPKFIASSIAFLRDYINVEGLFRKAGSVARQRELRAKLEKGYDLNGSEPNDVASLLKQWLRELPEPLIPNYLHDLYIRCQQLETKEDRINANLLTCLLLPQDHLFTLKYLLSFLGDVAAHSDKNKMDFKNVAMIMAPNIFVLGADSTDKSSPDLFELYKCVLEGMIENASKVGEVPISVQLSALEGKSCSELDSSGDILDFSPCKSRKKRKSGTVQDIFNGIKKLVGQSATPALNGAPRSAAKRKAEHNDGSLPKKLTVEVNGERISASETPKNKGSSKLAHTDGKAHTRRKSFGLLRRKERKKQKSAQESPQSKMSLGVKSPFSWNFETNKTNDSLKVPSPISPFNIFGSDKALKCDSIKKSTSDCYLTVPAQKTFVLSVSSSQGELQDRPKASPYNLRTKFEGGQKSQMQSLESIQLEMKSIITDAEKERQNRKTKLAGIDKSPLSGTDEVFEASAKAESDDAVNIKRDDPLRKSSCRRKAHRSKSHAAKNVLEGIKVNRGDSENAASCSMLSETLVQLDAKLSRKGMTRSSHKNGITRQEAFIVKSKQKLKDSLDQLESPEVSKPVQKVQESPTVKDVKNRQIHKSQSVNLERKSDIHVSGKKVTKKTSRKASLIRGRPNTIKSGLPTDLSQRFSNDSIFLPSENAVSSNSSTREKEYFHKNKPHVEKPSSILHKETSPLVEKDDSLYFKFQNFALSTPPGASTQEGLTPEIQPNLNAAFPIFDDSSVKPEDSNLHLVVPPDVTQKRKLSLPISNRESTTPDSKIPRLRRSLDAKRSSFPKACNGSKSKTTTPKTSSSKMPVCNPIKIPVRCTDSLKDLSALEFSMNDSCFKTPNRVASPDSVTWVSGSKYLGFNLPFEDEEATNKRESIAMILKSKPGHVQAKVHLWDTKVRDSVYCTRSVPAYSTPTAVFGIEKLPSRDKKPLSVSKSCSSAFSTPIDPRKQQSKSQRKQMSSTKRKKQKLPLPPPPKFFVSEPNTPSLDACLALKDMSSGINEHRISLNSSPIQNPVMTEMKSSPTKDKMAPSENRKKGKRSSIVDNSNGPLKEATCTNPVMNESKNSTINNIEKMEVEICRKGKRNSLLDNENSPLKEVIDISFLMNESKNSPNGSPTKDEPVPCKNRKKGKRSSISDNQSHPLKEVTNISFGMNESNNSFNGSLAKDEVMTSNLSYRKKGERSSFSSNTPKKLSKKIYRSESSPCRPITKVLQRHRQETLLSNPLATANDNFLPNRRLLRSSASKSGSCLSIEKLRSDQMIDEWQCEM